MKKHLVLAAMLPLAALAQVGIGTSSPDASAAFEVQSTQKGILIPRMSTTDRDAIASPATGLMIYNTTSNSFEYYSGSAWAGIGPSSITNADVAANAAIAFSKLNISASDIQGLAPYSAGTGISITSGAVAIDNTVVTSTYAGSATIAQSLSAGGNADASAILTANSTSKGFLPPRMTASQKAAISNAAAGLIVYQTDGLQGLYVFDGTSWMHHSQWYSNTATTPSVFSHSKPSSLSASGANANVGIGSGTLAGLTDGDNNVALGVNALNDITTAGNSTAIGYGALSTTTGAGNSALGYNAGTNNITGTNNTFVGSGSSSLGTGMTNATAIGYGAEVTTSNTIQLGNSSVTNVNTAGGITTGGSVGVGTTSPNASAILDLSSTSKGFLPPRVTNAQKTSISSPAEGLMVYNTSNGLIEVYQKNYGSASKDLDQIPNPLFNPSAQFSVTGGNSAWQAFTPTQSGIIDSIILYQNNPMISPTTTFEYAMKVYSGVTSTNLSLLIGGTLIGQTSAFMPTNNNMGERTYHFKSPVYVTAGVMYWFQISQPVACGSCYADTGKNLSDTYANNNTWVGGHTQDLLFKVYMRPDNGLNWVPLK